MNKRHYIRPTTEIIMQMDETCYGFGFSQEPETGTVEFFANENTFEDEDDPWNNLSGWDDLGSWGIDE